MEKKYSGSAELKIRLEQANVVLRSAERNLQRARAEALPQARETAVKRYQYPANKPIPPAILDKIIYTNPSVLEAEVKVTAAEDAVSTIKIEISAIEALRELTEDTGSRNLSKDEEDGIQLFIDELESFKEQNRMVIEAVESAVEVIAQDLKIIRKVIDEGEYDYLKYAKQNSDMRESLTLNSDEEQAGAFDPSLSFDKALSNIRFEKKSQTSSVAGLVNQTKGRLFDGLNEHQMSGEHEPLRGSRLWLFLGERSVIYTGDLHDSMDALRRLSLLSKKDIPSQDALMIRLLMERIKDLKSELKMLYEQSRSRLFQGEEDDF